MAVPIWVPLICLVMLFFTGIASQDCDESRHKLEETNQANLELLTKKMGSTIPIECMDNVINFASKPNEENFKRLTQLQAENATVAIQEILQEILHLFSDDHAKMAWDENTIAAFKAGMNREIGDLRPCLGTGDYIDIIPIVKAYFQRIKDELKDKDYSICTWEIAQLEIRECLLAIAQLIKRMHSEGTAKCLEKCFN
uniref:Uncharacterized protein n=1 Tax=Varanus komodoensis TaxID=61221 RepID=A0A8D2LLB7_VARKO